jgi:hypothetical protein
MNTLQKRICLSGCSQELFVHTTKLNKQQLKEFQDSGISEKYAELNFVNIPKKAAAILLRANTTKDIALKGTALDGGWASHDLKIYKPKTPRKCNGDLVKYETIDYGLTKINHPCDVEVDDSYLYLVEGLKKAVAVAQATKGLVIAFPGLSLSDKIIEVINKFDKYPKRLIIDNDTTLSAVKTAKKLASKFSDDTEIAIFSGFKGIDDALSTNGFTFSQVKFIPVREWSASLSGYIDSNNYTFSSAQFHAIEIPSNIRLAILQAGKGTGKTWYMSYLAQKRMNQGNVFVLTHRINLSSANAKKLGIPYIEDEGYISGSVGLCIDSIRKIKLDDCIGATIFIDEFTQVLDHLNNSGTLKNERSAIYRRFSEILVKISETNGLIVVADADTDAKSVKLLKALGDIADKDIFLIRNTYTFDKGLALYSEGICEAKGKGASKRKRPVDVVAKILKEAQNGKRLFVCCSAQKVESKYSTTTLEHFLITEGIDARNILRIDSNTIKDKRHPAFKASANINQLCERYQIILASPSLNTGIDIQYKGFDYVIGFASGILDSNGVRQFLSRVRDWKATRIFYAPEISQKPLEANLTSKSDLDLFKQSQADALKSFDSEWFSNINETLKEKIIPASTDYYLKQSWEKKQEKYEYAKRIKQGLIGEGFKLQAFQPEITETEASVFFQKLEAISEDLETCRKLTVEENEIESEEIAKRLYESEFLTVEEECGLQGYEIRKQLNLPPTVEVQTALAKGKRSQLENNFAALDGYEITKQLWEREQYWKGDRLDTKESASDYVKRNLKLLRIKELHKLSFFNIIRQPFDSDVAEEFLSAIRNNPLNLKLFPGLPDKETKRPIKAIKALANLFNFTVREHSQNHRGKRSYIAEDSGFTLSDTFDDVVDVKPQIFEYWREKRNKSVEDWKAFKRDIYKVKLGKQLDNSSKLPKLSDAFKYSKLSTRAKTLPLPKQPAYKLVDSSNVSEFTQWLIKVSEVAVDTETYSSSKLRGLDPINGFIRLVQLADDKSIWMIERNNFDLARQGLIDLLTNSSQRKIFHNAMFDLRFLRKEFDVLVKNCADTMLGSRCLLGDMGAAQITKHSLGQACENFLGIEVDKAEQSSDWGGTLTTEQLDYAAKDPWLTFVLYKRLEALTKQPSMLLLPFPEMMAWDAWEVENSFLFAAQQMENTGYEIDAELFASTKAQYQAVRDELVAKWDAPYLPTQKGKLQQFINEKYGLSLKSLGKAIAAENSDISEIKLMQQICACNAILTTLTAIEAQVEINQGRVKPVFKVVSGTGRTSSGATKINKALINLQSLAARVNPVLKEFNLPALKALFKTNLIIDLPASHGRISAELGNDINALAAYMDDSIDMHCQTASAVAKAVFPDAGYTSDWIQTNKKNDQTAKGLRDTAKNTYYGWLNGAGVSTIQRQIKSNLQILADKFACQKALEGLQEVFAGTTAYAKGKLKELEENQFIVNGVVCGWMEFAGTYLCWKLGVVGGDLKVPATKAFAGIWSRTESILMKKAGSRIAAKFDEMKDWDASLQNFIHDEYTAEIGCNEAALFAHEVIKEEFGKVCPRTISGFDKLEKCYPLQNWSQK